MLFPGRLQLEDLKPQLSLAWMISLSCVVVYVICLLVYDPWPSPQLIKNFKDKGFPTTLVAMYEQTLDPIEQKVYQSKNQETEKLFMAIRDMRFWHRMYDFPFNGDQVRIEKNKEIIKKISEEYLSSSQYQLGLGGAISSPWNWITYQFTHANLIHLAGNVLFLFLVISYLETFVSSAWIIVVYLFGGFAGGVSFLWLESSGDFSVVGASGAVCSLMAFLMIIKKNEPIPWLYFLAPIQTPTQKGYGEIYLPAYLIFPVYLLTDFLSVLWDQSSLSTSVAHTAHIGGVLMGCGLGLIYLFLQYLLARSEVGSKTSAHRVFSNDDRFKELF